MLTPKTTGMLACPKCRRTDGLMPEYSGPPENRIISWHCECGYVFPDSERLVLSAEEVVVLLAVFKMDGRA